MAENNEPVTTTEETTQETTGENTQPTTETIASASVLNNAVEEVMDMIDLLGNFAPITRGALGIGNGLSCEIAPSTAQAVFLDKNTYIPLTLALNGKHSDLQVLSDTLNNITDTLTRMTSYTEGSGFEIVDITAGNLPRIIGREGNNQWLMACDLIVKIYRKEE